MEHLLQVCEPADIDGERAGDAGVGELDVLERVEVVRGLRYRTCVVVNLYAARDLMAVNAREHGGERRQCRLQSCFDTSKFRRFGCMLVADPGYVVAPHPYPRPYSWLKIETHRIMASW